MVVEMLLECSVVVGVSRLSCASCWRVVGASKLPQVCERSLARES